MLEFVVEKLSESKGLLPRVADESGVPYRSLQKIASGEWEDPGVSAIQALADYYRSERGQAVLSAALAAAA